MEAGPPSGRNVQRREGAPAPASSSEKLIDVIFPKDFSRGIAISNV
jgi:hypothetical protein